MSDDSIEADFPVEPIITPVRASEIVDYFLKNEKSPDFRFSVFSKAIGATAVSPDAKWTITEDPNFLADIVYVKNVGFLAQIPGSYHPNAQIVKASCPVHLTVATSGNQIRRIVTFTNSQEIREDGSVKISARYIIPDNLETQTTSMLQRALKKMLSYLYEA